MGVEARYTEQMPFVGTVTQYEHVSREATERRIAKAQVVREALDARYGLVDGEPAPHEA